MALDVTVGGASADSYVSVADANTLLSNRHDAKTWLDKQTVERERALRQATELLDRFVFWVGTANNDTQALQWPRTGGLDRRGRSISSSTIPTWLQLATAEYAWVLLIDAEAGSGDLRGVKRIRHGRSETEFTDSADALPPADRLPRHVWRIIQDYGRIPSYGRAFLVRS